MGTHGALLTGEKIPIALARARALAVSIRSRQAFEL